MSERVMTAARLPVDLRQLIDRTFPLLRLRSRQEFVETALEHELLRAVPVITDDRVRSDILRYFSDQQKGGANDVEGL